MDVNLGFNLINDSNTKSYFDLKTNILVIIITEFVQKVLR